MSRSNPPFPRQLGEYLFERQLHPRQSYQRFSFAVYRHPSGAVAIAKRSCHSIFSLDAWRLQREIELYRTWQLRASQAINHGATSGRSVRLPIFLGAYRQNRTTLLLLEMVPGESIEQSFMADQFEAYIGVVDFLQHLNAVVSPVLPWPHLTTVYQVLAFPYIWLRAFWYGKNERWKIVRLGKNFFEGIPRLILDQRVGFVHRDLLGKNIIQRTPQEVVVLDFDVAAIMHPYLDSIKLLLGVWSQAEIRNALIVGLEKRQLLPLHDAVWPALAHYTALFELGLPKTDRSAVWSFIDWVKQPIVHRMTSASNEVTHKIDHDGGHRPTVSIFVAAYNEAANIRNFLSSVLRQREQSFEITEILVISDGSTDRTVAEAKLIDDPRLTVVASPERIGKSEHLNTFFRQATGEYLVFFDADVLLDNPETIAELLQPLLIDSKVGLVGGNAQQTPGRTFIENAVNLSCSVFDQIRILHHGGNNAFGANGCIMALSRAFARQVHVPSDTIANDQFLYFSCKQFGFSFVHARRAIAWYRSPSTLRDHLKQNKRFVAAHYRMERLFGRETVAKEYAVDPRLLRRLKFRAVRKKPFHAIGLFVVNLYCHVFAKIDEAKLDARWYMATTTKEKIEYEHV